MDQNTSTLYGFFLQPGHLLREIYTYPTFSSLSCVNLDYPSISNRELRQRHRNERNKPLKKHASLKQKTQNLGQIM